MLKSDSFLMKNWTDEFLTERTETPQVWTTFDEFEIQEIKPNRVDEIIDIIRKYYIIEEPSMVGCQMFLDNESIDQFLYLAQYWIMDSISTIAIEQKTGNIIGFIICRFNELSTRDPVFNKEMIYDGIKWKELNKFNNFLTNTSNVFEHYNTDKILEVNLWFVLPEYRERGIGSELLKNVMYRQLAEFEWFHVDVIVGVFTGKTCQRIAKSLGMRTLYNFMYAEWLVKQTDDETESGQIFFKEMIPGNYSAKVMSIRIGTSVTSEFSTNSENA